MPCGVSTMFLLCLIAALSGTPLRQAEAANDFARSIGELGQEDVIETVDGGVGDDTEASILKAGSDTHSLPATILLAMADVHVTPLIPASSFRNIGDRRRAGLSGLLPASSDRRYCLAPMLPVLMRVGETTRCCLSATQPSEQEHSHARRFPRLAFRVRSR